MKKIILTAIFVLGCAQPQSHFQIDGFEVYYNSFVENTGRTSNNLIITYADLFESGHIGECHLGGGITSTVVVDIAYWSTASEPDRQELIDHELGHCILGRINHDDSVFPNGVPRSIMNSHHFDPAIIKANHYYYYNELVVNK